MQNTGRNIVEKNERNIACNIGRNIANDIVRNVGRMVVYKIECVCAQTGKRIGKQCFLVGRVLATLLVVQSAFIEIRCARIDTLKFAHHVMKRV